MMKITHAIACSSLACVLSACIYVPKVKDDSSSPSCKTYTKSMTLEQIEVHQNLSVRCNNDECLAVLLTAAAVSAGSAIISGSIVVTNNTVHWLEYQGTCDDSYLNTAKQRFLDSVSKPEPAPHS
jgi:hypothetical protein